MAFGAHLVCRGRLLGGCLESIRCCLWDLFGVSWVASWASSNAFLGVGVSASLASESPVGTSTMQYSWVNCAIAKQENVEFRAN